MIIDICFYFYDYTNKPFPHITTSPNECKSTEKFRKSLRIIHADQLNVWIKNTIKLEISCNIHWNRSSSRLKLIICWRHEQLMKIEDGLGRFCSMELALRLCSNAFKNKLYWTKIESKKLFCFWLSLSFRCWTFHQSQNCGSMRWNHFFHFVSLHKYQRHFCRTFLPSGSVWLKNFERLKFVCVDFPIPITSKLLNKTEFNLKKCVFKCFHNEIRFKRYSNGNHSISSMFAL